MPIIQVNLLEGRTVEQKRELARQLTDATIRALGVKPESVRILMHEMGSSDFAVAGVTAMDRMAAEKAAAAKPAKTSNGAAVEHQVAS